MKCNVPEISWHNRDPVLSVDIHLPKLCTDGPLRMASAGNDSHVVVWLVTLEDGNATIDPVSDLTHHLKPVNVVRFAPIDEVLLASADDDGHIIVWRQQPMPDLPPLDGDVQAVNQEHYAISRTLRGHLQDVYDIGWSADGSRLISGAVDNTAILWDVQKGVKLKMLMGHGSFVQGVAWDPLDKLVATLSCDRHLRIFNILSGKPVAKVQKAKLPCINQDGETEEKVVRLFHDDMLNTFCRRLTFSPDGTLLLAPTGLLEPRAGRTVNVVHVFSRHDLTRPVFSLPSADKFTIAVRCCPTLFKLRMRGAKVDPSRPLWEQTKTLVKLPYRMVIAVANKSSILLYDTQQSFPFARISNIHFTRLTDITWSRDGRLLVVSSTDGFCSIVTFEPGELGEVYNAETTSSAAAQNQEVSKDSTEDGVTRPHTETVERTDDKQAEGVEEKVEDPVGSGGSDVPPPPPGRPLPVMDIVETETEETRRRVPLITLSSPRKPPPTASCAEPSVVSLPEDSVQLVEQDSSAGGGEQAEENMETGEDLVLHLEETTRELDAPAEPQTPGRTGPGVTPSVQASPQARQPCPSPARTPRRVPLVTLSSPKARRTPVKAASEG